MTTTRGNTALIALLAAMLLAGCEYLPFGYTSIQDIVSAPANFEGKVVKLKGSVHDITRVPFLEFRSFVLRDDSGEIMVITKGILPARHADVALEGTVKSAAIIGGQSLGLRVQETRRLR